MKLHLPKILAASLVAAMFAPQSWGADLTWTEPGTTSSLNDSKWTNGSAGELAFTDGDNAIFSGTDVGCRGGTIHANDVNVNSDTTLAGSAAIYSSGTVTIGAGCTLKLDGADLHVANAIKAGDAGSSILAGGTSAPGNIYYEGDYIGMLGVNPDEWYNEGSFYGVTPVAISKFATIFDGSDGALSSGFKMYIDGGEVGEIAPGRVYTQTLYNAYYRDFNTDTKVVVDDICSGEHADTNAIVLKGTKNAASVQLSENTPITLIETVNTLSVGSGKLAGLYLDGGITHELQQDTQVTFPDLVITAYGQNGIANNSGSTQNYNSTEVTMKNLKVEVAEAGKDVTLRTQLENVDIVNAKEGTKLTLTQGKGAASVTSAAAGAEVNLINISDGTDFALKALNISHGGKMGVYKNGTAGAGTDDVNVGTLTLAEGSKIVIGDGGGMLEANLTTLAGSTLDFSAGVALTMGCDLNVGTGTYIVLGVTDYNNLMKGEEVTLFTGVDNSFCMEVTEYVTCNPAATGGENGEQMAKVYLQTVGGKAVLSTTAVPTPEPATGTLSLLALAGLMARRRRKS